MFGGQALYAFQLDHQHVFDEDVSEVFPDVVAFVSYCKRGLTLGPDVTKGEFSEQFGQGVEVICRSSAANIGGQ